jgi:short-subunit dehydrogenase
MVLKACIRLLVQLQLLFLISFFVGLFARATLLQEVDLPALYGPRSWVLITGCSSGQGRRFAIEFARRRFNIILVGRDGIRQTAALIRREFPLVQTECVVLDFKDAHKDDFFEPIEAALEGKDLSVLVNNVGHRTAWAPYTDMPVNMIRDTIVCGTIVQARLSQIALRKFQARKKVCDRTSLLLNITAMCGYSTPWIGELGHFSLPYLSVYEAANAFGFYHSNSLSKEYEHDAQIQILNIMPGAVVTENTDVLNFTPFNVGMDEFVRSVFKRIGTHTGPQYGHWKHELSSVAAGIAPSFFRDGILSTVAEKLTFKFMTTHAATTRAQSKIRGLLEQTQ